VVQYRSKAKVFLTGDKALDKKLSTLEGKVRNKIARKAIRKAAKPVLDAAKANVPVESGKLRKSLTIRALRKSSKNKFRVGARVTTRDGLFSGETFYGGFVEFGTATQAPRPFLIPALASNSGRVDSILREEIRTAIMDEAAKG